MNFVRWPLAQAPDPSYIPVQGFHEDETMRKAQVLLREDQKAALLRLSHRTGRSQSELMRHGVDLAIAEAETTPAAKAAVSNQDWKKAWFAAAGMWADRDDLDEARADLRVANQRRDAEMAEYWRRK